MDIEKTMIVQNKIQNKLIDQLEPAYLEVVNESHMHNVPPGSESHFKIVLVSDQFETLPLIKRHQAIYETLAKEMKNGIHALAIHALTRSEFKLRHGELPASPPCLGGGKK
jgi:BolA protein